MINELININMNYMSIIQLFIPNESTIKIHNPHPTNQPTSQRLYLTTYMNKPSGGSIWINIEPYMVVGWLIQVMSITNQPPGGSISSSVSLEVSGTCMAQRWGARSHGASSSRCFVVQIWGCGLVDGGSMLY